MLGVRQLTLVLCQLMLGLCHLALYPRQLRRETAEEEPRRSPRDLLPGLPQFPVSLCQLRRMVDDDRFAIGSEGLVGRRRKLEMLDGGSAGNRR
jgi:hypothetical protein